MKKLILFSCLLISLPAVAGKNPKKGYAAQNNKRVKLPEEYGAFHPKEDREQKRERDLEYKRRRANSMTKDERARLEAELNVAKN